MRGDESYLIDPDNPNKRYVENHETSSEGLHASKSSDPEEYCNISVSTNNKKARNEKPCAHYFQIVEPLVGLSLSRRSNRRSLKEKIKECKIAQVFK